jgi:Derlin-2/3
MSSPEEWYRSLPRVTRGFMTAALGATLGVQLQLVSPLLLFLDFGAIFGGLELWRLLTNFVFFGPFGFPFVMSIFFLVRYTKELEIRRFEGRTADFLWAMLFMGALQAAVAYVLGGIPFLSQAMLSALVYLWSREHADTVLSVFGLFNVQGFYWPWVLVALRVLMGGSPIDDLVGIFSGHVYYFLEDVQVRPRGRPPLLRPRQLSAHMPSTSHRYS